MKSYASVPKIDTHVKHIELGDNFPAAPKIGQLFVYTNNNLNTPFMYDGEQWVGIQLYNNLVIPMNSDFPKNPKTASLFFNNDGGGDFTEDGTPIPANYGLYLVNEDKQFVKLLDETHTAEFDPHPTYLGVEEARSTYQPLNVLQTVSQDTQIKVVKSEFWSTGLFRTPNKFAQGMYKFEILMIVDKANITLNFRPDFQTLHWNQDYSMDVDGINYTKVSGYLNLENDTNIVSGISCYAFQDYGRIKIKQGSFINFTPL